VPATHQLAKFGGNMSVARGTTYSLRDAWTEFVRRIGAVAEYEGFAAILVGVGVVAATLLSAFAAGGAAR